MIRKPETILRMKLNERGLTPKKLHDATGVPTSSIYAALNGTATFSRKAEHLDQLNKFFGTINDELLRKGEEFQEPETPLELKDADHPARVIANSSSEIELKKKITALLESNNPDRIRLARIHLDALALKIVEKLERTQ